MFGAHFSTVSVAGNYSESFQRHNEEFERVNEDVFKQKVNDDGC